VDVEKRPPELENVNEVIPWNLLEHSPWWPPPCWSRSEERDTAVAVVLGGETSSSEKEPQKAQTAADHSEGRRLLNLYGVPNLQVTGSVFLEPGEKKTKKAVGFTPGLK